MKKGAEIKGKPNFICFILVVFFWNGENRLAFVYIF